MPSENPEPNVSEEVVEEACYYLRQLGMSFETIGEKFEITRERAEELYSRFQHKLTVGLARHDALTKNYWESVFREAAGDVKVTFLSQDGFHHGWKSDLESMDDETLMMIFERSKVFLETDANKYFLNIPPPPGYDPLAFSRQVKTAVEVIEQILTKRSAEETSVSG